MRWFAAISCVCAVMVARPTPATLIPLRLGRASSRRRSDYRWVIRRAPFSFGLIAITAVIFVGFGLAHLIVAITLVGVCWTAWRLWSSGRLEKRRLRNRDEVAEAVEAVAAELAGGMLPVHALAHIADDVELLEPAAFAAQFGGSVGEAMRVSGLEPGADQLTGLAAAWEIAERSGAPMVSVLERLAESMRDEREILREISAGVGPAKATSRLMAVLPAFGLVLGSGLGADPVDTLLNTLLGSVLLAAGCTLSAVGVLWVDRIAVRAGRF